MKPKQNNRSVGTHYERMAAEYLVGLGYRIREQNYHAGRLGEIDIIAEDSEGTIVFCECKYRADTGCGDPLESVGPGKQRQICRIAAHYCAMCGYGEYTPCRFDVIGIYGDGRLRHIPNAFLYQG
ncbi:MAG: YraN family protein [Clostridiales bacterium]|nr:YraN family protein [Clostridiales bacterium]